MKEEKYRMRDYISLPDLFSIANVSFGFLSIIMTMKQEWSIACQLMLVAIVFDSLDGWIARKIKRDNPNFGMNVDSLCDALSFGTAPAIFVYSTTSFRYINILVSLLIVTCGILRLSRFNVTANVKKDNFIGLPIPVMAGAVSAVYLSGFFHSYAVILLVTILSFLMISSVNYPKIDTKTGTLVIILLAATILLGARIKIFAMILFLMIIAYIFIPFVLEIRRGMYVR